MKETLTHKVRAITKEELTDKLKKREQVQIVNVLDPQHYDLGIIPGSKKIPLAELEDRLGELDKSKEVVTYCANINCMASRKAAELLVSKGFKVSAYEGGIEEWTAASLPVENI